MKARADLSGRSLYEKAWGVYQKRRSSLNAIKALEIAGQTGRHAVASLDGQYTCRKEETPKEYFRVNWEPVQHTRWQIELFEKLGYCMTHKEPHVLEPDDDTPCEVCGSADRLPGEAAGSDHLICDGCNTAWHGRCMTPPILSVPEGD